MTDRTNTRIGLIGTGLMGRPMAERLLTAGFELTVWNRTLDRARPLAALGAAVASDPPGVIAAAEAIVVMLSDARAIHETLLLAESRSLLAGRTALQMGTIGPSESVDVAHAVTAHGGSYLEAPVLGSIPEAAAGRLVVMVGSDRDLYRRWLPVLRCFGPEPRHIGAVGDAAALKLALNQLIATITTAYAHSLALVRRAGIDVNAYADIVRHSALFAPTFDKKLPRMLERDYEPANFPTRHLLKDVRLFQAEARRLGVVAPALDGVGHVLENALALGLGDADYSALAEAVDPAPDD